MGRPDDRPENHAQFDLVATVHYRSEHEQVAKSINIRLRELLFGKFYVIFKISVTESTPVGTISAVNRRDGIVGQTE